jgi:hypothetical protein
MCFGRSSSRSAQSIYEEKKPEEKPLPSLSMKPVDRPEQVLGDVPKMRKGMQRRSLLGMGRY